MSKFIIKLKSGSTIVYGFDAMTGFYYVFHDPTKITEDNIDGIVEIRNGLYDNLTGKELADILVNTANLPENHEHVISANKELPL
jgi:hypothetical protein